MALEHTILQAMQAAEKENAPVSGDYTGEDGLLRCGNCHTPKQWRGVLPGLGMTVVACSCRCHALSCTEAREKQRRESRIQALRDDAFDTLYMQQWNFAGDDHGNPALTTAMERYVTLLTEEPPEAWRGLLLSGPVGCGKTYAAAETVNALIDREIPCKMTGFSRIAGEYQDSRSRTDVIDRLHRYRLLVIDDLGAERTTSYMNEIVYQVIDARFRSGLPLIVTTNLTLEEIKKPQSPENQRIYSRILEMCHPIAVSGRDRRRQKAADHYNAMKAYLGL